MNAHPLKTRLVPILGIYCPIKRQTNNDFMTGNAFSLRSKLQCKSGYT